MKKILLFAFILATNWCTAQIYVNQQNLSASNFNYLEVWEKFNRSTNKFYAMVDYGQHLQAEDTGNKLKLRNMEGSAIEFNSVVAILNFFYLNGWELAEMKSVEDAESFILKKRRDFVLPVVGESSPPSTSVGSTN